MKEGLIDNMSYQELTKEAFIAQKKAYAPYSNYHVGAAILLDNGQIIHGCNIENAAYGSTMCAERNAIYSTYCQGYQKDQIKALAIVGSGGDIIKPCGACLQVIVELLDANTPIILSNQEKSIEVTIKDLLPYAFTGEDLYV